MLAGQPELAEVRLRADRRAARVDERRRLHGDDDRDARAGRLRPGRGWPRPRELCAAAAAAAADDDIVTQVIWRGVQAKILAREGRCEEAEALAREAVALVEPTDLLSHHGDAMLDLAEVLRTCDSPVGEVVDAVADAAQRCTNRRATSCRQGERAGCSRTSPQRGPDAHAAE